MVLQAACFHRIEISVFNADECTSRIESVATNGGKNSRSVTSLPGAAGRELLKDGRGGLSIQTGASVILAHINSGKTELCTEKAVAREACA